MRSHDFVRLSDLFGSLWACAFFYGDPDGERPESLIRKGTSCWGAFLLIWFTLRYDTAGRTLGAARPQTCAKESLTLWTLFMWGAVEYLFAQVHWPCDAFRGENAGAEMWKPHCGRPRLRQRAKCGSRTAASLDSLHWIRGKVPLANLAITAILELPHARPAALGYTERPARLQFMVGQVGLYTTNISCFARQQVEPALPASRPQAARSRVACAKRRGCRTAAILLYPGG